MSRCEKKKKLKIFNKRYGSKKSITQLTSNKNSIQRLTYYQKKHHALQSRKEWGSPNPCPGLGPK